MTKFHKWAWLTLGLAALLAYPGCKPPDTTAPTTVVTTPDDLSHYDSGEQITVKANFTDNRSLMQYSILVVSTDYTEGMEGLDLLGFFEFGKIWALEPVEEASESQAIEIPVDVASGKYEIRVWCVDERGNQSIEEKVPIVIQNSTDQMDPVLTVHVLDEGQVNNVPFGQPITLDTDMTDDQKLGALYVKLVQEATGSVEQDFAIELTAGASQSVLTNVPAPKFPGKYKLTVSASDYVNNLDTKVYNLQVN